MGVVHPISRGETGEKRRGNGAGKESGDRALVPMGSVVSGEPQQRKEEPFCRSAMGRREGKGVEYYGDGDGE